MPRPVSTAGRRPGRPATARGTDGQPTGAHSRLAGHTRRVANRPLSLTAAHSAHHRLGSHPTPIVPIDPITAYINLGISAGEWITLQEGITSIPHIPHQACEEWKSCFLTVIREAIAKHDTERREAAFNLLLLLPALLLTPGPRKKRQPLLRDVVKRRCRLFLQGQLEELIRERDDQLTVDARYRASRAGRGHAAAMDSTPSAAEHRKHVSRIVRLVNAGQFGKARNQLLSPGIAEPSPEVLQQLRDKHPGR